MTVIQCIDTPEWQKYHVNPQENAINKIKKNFGMKGYNKAFVGITQLIDTDDMHLNIYYVVYSFTEYAFIDYSLMSKKLRKMIKKFDSHQIKPRYMKNNPVTRPLLKSAYDKFGWV